MTLENTKIYEKDLEGMGVVGMPEVPGLSAEEMQRKVEEIPREVIIKKFNELIDWLITNGATQNDLQNILINAGSVTGVFGRRGEVKAQKGDYTAEMVGAAAEKHAATHRADGSDPLDAVGIGAAPNEHGHGNISRDGKIGNTNGKVLVTGLGGIVEAKDKEEAGFMVKPLVVGSSGDVSFTVEGNKEYEYTDVSNLTMTGANVACHGTITFGETVGTVTVTEFSGILGDDIADAAAGETWEFDVLHGRIIWANWGAI